MNALSDGGRVMVSGASGYIASWVVKLLLERGHTVVGTVRSLSDASKVDRLKQLERGTSGKLELVAADLLQPASFNDAMEGCEVVIHTASPFMVSGVKDPQRQLVDPALEGTRNVLAAANRTASVKRVVLTSSVAAIYGDACDVQQAPGGVFTEEQWNETSSLSHNAYSFSKLVAEREAWKLAEEQQRWSLVVINPGFVFGPSLSQRVDSTSVDFMRSLLNGKMKMGVPALSFSFVDVREVAEAHLQAAIRPEAGGRHILVADSLSMIEMARHLRQRLGEGHPIPRRVMPKPIFYLAGPFFGFSWKMIGRNWGEVPRFDNARSRERLGIHYREADQTLVDHAQQLLDDGLV